MGEDEKKDILSDVEEITVEPEETGEDLAHGKIEKLKADLEAIKKERQEYLDGWQRCKADAINARRDMDRDVERRSGRLRDSLIEELLPALDAFDMASASADWETLPEGWRGGMEHVRSQLLAALKKSGVEHFGRAGETYDPMLHEVMEERSDIPGEPGTIHRVIRHGYRSGERIIRPAHVIVKNVS